MKNQYKSYQESVDFLKECAKEYPHLIKIQNIGTTWEGRDIILATVSLDVEYADLKPALLYTGTIHAREWIGNELAIEFIKYVIENYKKNPLLSSALIRNTLYMVPCLNPDGFEYSRNHFAFWRKNRRDNKDGTFGVDLNRNFSVGFVKSTNTSSNVYGGPYPFSEPETRAIKEFVDSHPNITVALDYHSQGNVFFPAHKFRHEAELDGTDINILCANMNYEIMKVTGREYGIHRGKPPTKLISGSGREYYYSKGIAAAVVEVGTRNIPDYMQNMSENIHEHIPALIYALNEAKNHSKSAPKMVENFTVERIDTDCVELVWEYENDKDIYFEIYRNKRNKQPCRENSLIAVTKDTKYIDKELESGTEYYYYIRAYDRTNNVKSRFSPKLRIKTLLDRDEFSRTIFPLPKKVGYVGEFTKEQNRSHFGKNSLFIGVNKSKGICYGVMEFDLSSIPKNAIIKYARLSLYPMNRVGVKIEKYGEWAISFIDEESVSDITDFDEIHNAKSIETLGDTIKSEKLTQGIWSHWNLNAFERKILADHLEKQKVLFKVEGPTKLPLGRDSQMMQFDIGYGKFGGGIHYRPNLEIKYTIPPTKIELKPIKLSSIYTDNVVHNELKAGFDENKNKIYGYMEFDLSSLPDPDKTVIVNAYIVMQNKNKLTTKKDVRFNIEFIDKVDSDSYEAIKNRKSIEYVGYDIGRDDLTSNKKHFFIFDTYSMLELEKLHEEDKTASFIVKATSLETSSNQTVDWYSKDDEKAPSLVIEYIPKRKKPLEKAKNLKASLENGMIKLTWENPKDKDFVGAYVVRNRFHPPKTPFDGVKLYAGKDNYTYDNFGTPEIGKYYAVFVYDNVPNYSEPEILAYKIENDGKSK
ncbi:MAG: peptidase [Epsilonproteobacteria bacterium]|nr:peptidase [Campylobacterota bacterium]